MRAIVTSAAVTSKVDTTLSRPLADRLGDVIAGRYRIRGLIAKGGTGAVYEAERVDTGETFAIKTVLPGLGQSAPELAQRFAREAYATARLAHPNIVAVVDLVAEDADLYLVMERLRGSSLAEAMELGALAPRRALVLARQILEALGHAHALGMIHRDIKPDNVIVETVGEPGREHERAKLLDFGLVKLVNGDTGNQLTAMGAVFGTPAYISPEQALGRVVDARADLYSTAVVLFEMLCGRKPYSSPDPATLVRMHAAAPIPTLANAAPGRPWCTPALEQLIAGALAKDPAARFADAAAMIAALDAAFLSLDGI